MIVQQAENPILTRTSGLRIGRLAICIVAVAYLWLQSPPNGLSISGWHVFIVFLGTIFGFILRPLPMGPLVLLSLATLVIAESTGETPHLSVKSALSGFANSTTWLVVLAILLSGSVIRTQLGTRLALLCFSILGRSSRGLAYAIGLTELILAPFIPSNTARGGGVIAPVVRSINEALRESLDAPSPPIERYFISCGAHSNLIASAMFLTSMAANPLVAEAGREVYGIDFTWTMWFVGAIVPGLVGLLLLPLLLRFIFPHDVYAVTAARRRATQQLIDLGSVTRNELLLIGVFVAMISLWISAPWHGVSTTAVCLCGVVAVLLFRIDRWENMIGHTEAWDTLVWLGGLLTMANALKQYGVIQFFSDRVSQELSLTNPLLVALALALLYFYSMYGFSMLTGHIIALAAAFFVLGQQAEAQPLLMIPLIAYLSTLCGCLTNYSTGPVIIYFNQGCIPPATWFRSGFLISIFHLAIWLGLGLPYWKWLGWW